MLPKVHVSQPSIHSPATVRPVPRSSRLDWRWLALLSGSIVCLLLGTFAWQSIHLARAWYLNATQGWATTPGTIVASAASAMLKSIAAGDNTSHYTVEDWASITYTYAVDGHALQSSRLHFAVPWNNIPGCSCTYTGKYPVGAQVVVHFDPQDPTFSALDPSVMELNFMILPVALSIALLAILIESGWEIRQSRSVKRAALELDQAGTRLERRGV